MQPRLPDAVKWPQAFLLRHWPHLVTLALVGLLAWLAVQWFWYFMTPTSVSNAPRQGGAISGVRAPYNVAAIGRLFGDAASAPVKNSEAVQVSTLGYQLKGVFAELGPHPAFAILNVNGKDTGTKVGEEVSPGVILESVARDHVLVRRQGVLERIEFPAQAGGMMGAPGLGARPQAAANVMNLSRAQVQNVLQDTSQLGNLGRVAQNPGGGIVVEEVPPGSLAERLGLASGDVVRIVNGLPVNSPADLVRLYQDLSEEGQIQVIGTRAGKPLQLLYTVEQ